MNDSFNTEELPRAFEKQDPAISEFEQAYLMDVAEAVKRLIEWENE